MLQIVHDVAPKAKLVLRHRVQRRDRIRQQHPQARRPERAPCGADVDRRRRRLLRRADLRATAPIARRGRRRRREGRALLLVGRQRGDAAGLPGAAAHRRARRAAPRRPNLDLSGVDPSLYAGGFHDFDPGRGVDVAQTTPARRRRQRGSSTSSGTTRSTQPAPPLGDPLLDATAEHHATDAPVATFPYDGTAGETDLQRTRRRDPVGRDGLLILTLIRPDGTILQQIDTGTSPETVRRAAAGHRHVQGRGRRLQRRSRRLHFDVREVTSAARW